MKIWETAEAERLRQIAAQLKAEREAALARLEAAYAKGGK